jgi:periplasmic divalent cation tolerance protein
VLSGAVLLPSTRTEAVAAQRGYNAAMASHESAVQPAEFVVVFMTAPDADVAGRIASALVEERLVACVNILPGLRSIYRWEGELCDEAEVLCLMKTRLDLFPALRDRIAILHPYQVPEIIALPLAAGSAPYLDWVRQTTTQRDPGVHLHSTKGMIAFRARG